MLKILEKYPITSICLLVALMLLPNLEVMQITIMEARNFITAREMVNNGNWLLTTMNGEARYQKPPLPTWITAFSGLIFGFKSVFGMRLPAICMIMIIGGYIYLLSNKLLKNKTHSLLNAVIVITSFYVIGITIEAPWDIFTHGFMLIAIYHLFQLFQKKKQYCQHTLIIGFCIGLSILSKGPISFYALLLPFILAYSFTYKFSKLKAKTFSFFSVLILALIVGGWWYLYIRFQDPETLITITKKETENWTSYKIKPFYYYWSFFTQSGIWAIPAFISLLYPYLKSRVATKKAYKFSFLWTIFVVILLSIIPEKKSRYLMPALIPLALNIGFYIDYLIRTFKGLKDKRETIPVYFNFGLIAFIGISYPIISYLFLKENLDGYWLRYSMTSIVLVSIGVLIIIFLKRKNIQKVLLLTVLLFASLLIIGLPLSKSLLPSNYKTISYLMEENSKQDVKVYHLKHVSPEMIWQYGDRIPIIKKGDGIFHFPKENKFGLLISNMTLEEESKLKSIYNMKQITTFDLNQFALDSKKYKTRLRNYYYVLTKKE